MAITLAVVENHEKAEIWRGGSSTDAGDIVLQTGMVIKYNTFLLTCTEGAMEVMVSLDGDSYITNPLSLTDLGATSSAPVLVTSANRMFGFRGYYSKIRVLQKGTADLANVVLVCGRAL